MTRAVLVVDDDRATRELLAFSLGQEGLAVDACASAQKAQDALRTKEYAALLTDLNLGGQSGIELCRWVVSERPETPVIVVTAFGSLDTAIAAIRAGAYDFITKPFDVEAVVLALNRAIQHRELTREVVRLRAAVANLQGFGKLVGDSTVMQRLYALLERVCRTDASVLIIGESGTGKELVARALHDRGPRGARPFVALNCAALPEPLLESELFGHERGAFTDAKTSKRGLFIEANGGSLFLDEIGDLPLGIQPKLLRALEQRTVRPLGGTVEIPFDARVIAATHRDLEAAVEAGTFREDLFYRLNVISIVLPPLRARGGDVLLLAQRFIEIFAERHSTAVAGMTRAAADKLTRYPWPGNVRELANCIERAVALSNHDKIGSDDLPEKIAGYRSERVVVDTSQPSELVSLEEMERRYILQVLSACGENRSLAAQVLGLNRKTLYRKLQHYQRFLV